MGRVGSSGSSSLPGQLGSQLCSGFVGSGQGQPVASWSQRNLSFLARVTETQRNSLEVQAQRS